MSHADRSLYRSLGIPTGKHHRPPLNERTLARLRRDVGLEANGDGRSYDCPSCDSEHPLDELLDHLEIAHPDLETTR